MSNGKCTQRRDPFPKAAANHGQSRGDGNNRSSGRRVKSTGLNEKVQDLGSSLILTLPVLPHLFLSEK